MRPTGHERAWPRNPGCRNPRLGRIWKAFGLKPHLEEGFKRSTDPFFTEKIYDIVGLYLHPPESAVVLCIDEKPGIGITAVSASVADAAGDTIAAYL